LAVLESRLPAKLFKIINNTLKEISDEFPAVLLSEQIKSHADSLELGERPRFHDITRPINELLERFKEGIEGHKKAVIGSLFQRYLDVEKVFLFLFLFFF